MKTPKRATPASHYLRGAMVVLALVLPTLSLAVLGTLWLWQNKLLLVWAVAASSTALLIYALEYWLVRRQEREAAERRGRGMLGRGHGCAACLQGDQGGAYGAAAS